MAKLFKKNKGDSPSTKRDCTNEMTLLILGCSESGKTTVWRHLQLLSDDSITEDKKIFQKLIYGNTVASINHLLDAAEKNNLPLSEENKEKILPVRKIPLVEKSERVATATMTEFKLPRFPLRLVYDFKCVWEDESIQQAYKITQVNPEFHTPGRLQYYMDNIFRILSPDFKPADLDILSVYEQSDSVRTSELYYRKVKVNALCYPGSVSDGKKWETISESADVIVYNINISEYDQYLAENKSQNKLQTAVNTLTDIFTSKTFKTCSHMFVFLTCLDVFKEKAPEIDLKCCFSEYSDGLDAEKALAYVHNYITQKVTDQGKPIKVVSLNAIEKESFAPVLDELVDVSLPSLPTINTQTPPPHLGNGTTNGEKKDDKDKEKEKEKEKERKEEKEKEKEKEKERKEEKREEKEKEKEKEKSKKKGKKLMGVESGFEAVQGRRKTMEDKHVILDNFRPNFPAVNLPEDVMTSYFAVYDGHGGGETSRIVEERLHNDIISDPVFPSDMEQAVKNGFLSTDTHILTQPSKSGSTAVIAVVVGNQLLVANIGDSECILCKTTGTGKKIKNEHVVMSYKHIPKDENEKTRISAAGGLVVFGRLFGSLAVSRSFGDRDYKDGGQHFVSAEPHIKQIEISPEDQCLVMACDGLWDKLSYDDVMGTVCRLRKEGKNATEICKVLVNDAINKESMDNITVVLIFFNWKK